MRPGQFRPFWRLPVARLCLAGGSRPRWPALAADIGVFATVITLLAVLVGGCSRAGLMKMLTSPQDEATAKKYVDLLRQKRFARIEEDVDPSLRSEDLRSTLVEMAALVPSQQPVSIKVVGMFRELSSSTTDITLEYEFRGQWLLADVATRRPSKGSATIVAFHVSSIPESVEHQNRFTLVGKGTPQYTILFLAALSAVVSIYAFVACLRTNIGKKKWLWAIATLLGVGTVGVNWTTGQIYFTLLAIHLLTFGAAAPLYGAWVVYSSLPLGAILFLMVRGGLRESAEKCGELPPDQTEPAPESVQLVATAAVDKSP